MAITTSEKTLITVHYALYCLIKSKFECQTSDYKNTLINNRLQLKKSLTKLSTPHKNLALPAGYKLQDYEIKKVLSYG